MSPRPLRVLSYTTLFPNPRMPFHGLFVRRRLEHLARLCDVRVVAPVNVSQDPAAAWSVPRSLDLDGVEVHHPRFAVAPGLFKRLDGDLLYLQSRGTARRIAAERPVDIVDAHYAFPDGFAAGRIAADLGKPYALSLRGSDIHVLTRFRGRRERIRRVLAGAAVVVAVSEDLARAARDLGAEPAHVRVVPNGVEVEKFTGRDRDAARKALGLRPEERLILSVGRLAEVKGFDLLLRAFAELSRAADAPMRCVILGEGPSRRSLSAIAGALGVAGSVDMPGWVEPSKLPDWYAAADAFVLLSVSEGCPNVVVESLASGTPVVATAVGGIPEMVRDGVNGFLVGERSSEAAAGALRRALGFRWDREAVRRSGAVRDWDSVAKAQLEALREATRAA